MSSPELVTTEPITVAFLSMRGPYAQMPEAFGRLYGLAGANGLNPVGMPAAVYFTSPQEVPEAEARWELWVPVAGDPAEREPGDDDFGVKRVAPALVASVMHRGPYETMATTYAQLMQFVASQGYAPAGPPMERYYSDPEEVPPEEYLTEIMMPVRSA